MKFDSGLWATVGVAALLATACEKKADVRSDTMAMRTDSMAMANSMARTDTMRHDSAGMAMGGSPAMTDANILAKLDQANMADSAAGAVAAKKGTSKDVREFGKEMMNDHHALRKGGHDLAAKLNITPVPPANDQGQAEAQSEIANLNSTPKGAAWDKAYIDGQVSDHQKVLSTLSTAAGQAQNAELKEMIMKAQPKVQKHLDRLLALQKKMASM
jgi:putative membrane protein